MSIRTLLLALALSALAVSASAREAACPLAGQKPMLIAELFFGRDIAGGAHVSDADWSGFAASTLTRYFPDGFTAFDADGQWQNPKYAKVISEPTKVVIIAAERSRDVVSKIEAVREAYKTAFHQQFVGVITRTECAAF